MWTQTLQGGSLTDAENADSILSRRGFMIMHAGVPIYWKSNLQTEIALSTCESEYLTLYASMRTVIPLIELSKEIKPFIDVHSSMPKMLCQVHEDNKVA